MGPYTVLFKPSAARAFGELPKTIQRRIAARMDALSENPRPPGTEALKGEEGLLRLRVGAYRIIYRIKEARLVVLVMRVGHRKDVYRGL